jgi:hypothetical protein
MMLITALEATATPLPPVNWFHTLTALLRTPMDTRHRTLLVPRICHFASSHASINSPSLVNLLVSILKESRSYMISHDTATNQPQLDKRVALCLVGEEVLGRVMEFAGLSSSTIPIGTRPLRSDSKEQEDSEEDQSNPNSVLLSSSRILDIVQGLITELFIEQRDRSCAIKVG